jgi:putative spermidine/putrescine transport system ATP-binding protein
VASSGVRVPDGVTGRSWPDLEHGAVETAEHQIDPGSIVTTDFRQLRLQDVTRRFDTHAGADKVAALSGLTITIERGEFVALLGPSGCGKSTALNCIAGLLRLSSGTIHLDDTRIDSQPPEKRGFGMVFQNYALFPHMNVRKNVGFGLRMRGMPAGEIEIRVNKALDLVQLHGHETKLPGQLSGGQQQRVAIARAIVIEPPLVLMDEPLSNLDARLRLEMRAEIRRIHRELGRSTIYVTHDQDEAFSLADRIVVIHMGVAQQVATPREIYGGPANLRVARFIGYRNVFRLPVERVEGDTVWFKDGRLPFRGRAKQRIETPRAVMALRPEEVVIGREGGANVAEGRVVNVEYCGRDSIVDVRIAPEILVHVRSGTRVSLDEQVPLSISPDRVLVYADEDLET